MKKLLSLLLPAFMIASACGAEMPQAVRIKCGDIETEFQQRSFWNMQGVNFKGKVAASPKSWYGTVTGGQGGKLQGWIGSGHMENKIGEKNVKITFKINGSEWTPSAGTHNVKSFELTKESDLGMLHLKYDLRIADNKIYEHVRTNMIQRRYILIYHFMYAWDISFSEYAFKAADGTVSTGKFQEKKANIYIPMPEKFGVFSPKNGIAAIADLKAISSIDAKAEVRLHDLPNCHKYYFVPTSRSTKRLEPGKFFEYSQTTSFYQCDVQTFMQKMGKTK